MSEQVHPGTHIDPEQVNAFLEGVLPEHERQEYLAHVAGCSRCREIVFFARPLSAAPEPATSKARAWWSGWFGPIPVLSGALASGALILGVIVYRRQAPVLQLEAPRAALEKSAQAPMARDAQALAYAVPSDRAPAKAASGGAKSTAAETEALRAPLPAQSPQTAGMSRFRDPETEATTLQRKALAAFAAHSNANKQGTFKVNFERKGDTLNGLSEVRGSVTDASGAALPGAAVSVQSIGGTTSFATVTGSDGHFAMAALPPGRYELQIDSRGFERAKVELELHPQEAAMLTTTLSIGSSAETVEVVADSPAAYASLNAAQAPAPQANALPSNLPMVSRADSGKLAIAADSAGALFIRRNGEKKWEAVKPQWQGKVRTVTAHRGEASAIPLSAGYRSSMQFFVLTTDTGAIWVSTDGTHWQAASPANLTPQKN